MTDATKPSGGHIWVQYVEGGLHDIMWCHSCGVHRSETPDGTCPGEGENPRLAAARAAEREAMLLQLRALRARYTDPAQGAVLRVVEARVRARGDGEEEPETIGFIEDQTITTMPTKCTHWACDGDVRVVGGFHRCSLCSASYGPEYPATPASADEEEPCATCGGDGNRREACTYGACGHPPEPCPPCPACTKEAPDAR